MKSKFFIVIIVLYCFLSCKKNTNKISKQEFYPYCKNFSTDGALTYDNETEILFQRFRYSDNRSGKVHFLNIKNDTVIINTKKVKKLPPVFIEDLFLLKENLIVLSSIPRTLGENLKSTDSLIKYDKNLQVLEKKDMDISKYPRGNGFIIGDSDRLFYITEGFKYMKTPELIISQIDTSFNIKNQIKIKTKEKGAFRYYPLKSVFIKDIGIVIVSTITYHNREKPIFKIEMFDFDLKKQWSQDIEASSIIDLGYSISKNKIFLISEKQGNKINIWDFKGNRQTKTYYSTAKLISSTSNDNYIYILNNEGKETFVSIIDYSGEIIDKVKKSTFIQTKESETNMLKYKRNQLFLITINNYLNTLTITKLKDSL
ncbi:hypothetical protein [Tenacibaculum sp. SDUM215027]|uniref:hypothetical protein n=1 Tax=Tenacibaculum sp. SDUM215027 TaxID=3422596 RepID=UPI003D31C3B9